MGLSLSFRNILLGNVLEPRLSLLPSANQFLKPLSYTFRWFFLAVLTFHTFPYLKLQPKFSCTLQDPQECQMWTWKPNLHMLLPDSSPPQPISTRHILTVSWRFMSFSTPVHPLPPQILHTFKSQLQFASVLLRGFCIYVHAPQCPQQHNSQLPRHRSTLNV